MSESQAMDDAELERRSRAAFADLCSDMPEHIRMAFEVVDVADGMHWDSLANHARMLDELRGSVRRLYLYIGVGLIGLALMNAPELVRELWP